MRTVSAADARSRLLAELAEGPSRRGYAIAYDLLGNRSEAEEAVQEALARACESIGDLRDPVAAPAWFLRIVTTVASATCAGASSSGRCSAASAGRAPRDEEAELEPSASLPGVVPGQPALAPVDALSTREDMVALLRCLDGLSAQQRTALVLRYGHELPVPEVAHLLGVELATAKTHLVRGLARLRDLMEDHR